MKPILWTVVAIVALLWTGGAALMSQLIDWAAQGLAVPGTESVGAMAHAATLPAWLSPWFDAAAWNAAVQTVAGMISSASNLLPSLGEAMGWLVPAVWVAWGLGLVALIALAGAGHWWMGRMGRLVTGPSPVR
jgi:hypothetical protein